MTRLVPDLCEDEVIEMLTRLPEQYDAFVHDEQTSALHPLHAEPESEKPPEVYPWEI